MDNKESNQDVPPVKPVESAPTVKQPPQTVSSVLPKPIVKPTPPPPYQVELAIANNDPAALTSELVRLVSEVLTKGVSHVPALKEAIDRAGVYTKYVDSGQYAFITNSYPLPNDDHRFAAFVVVLIGAKRISVLTNNPVSKQTSVDKIGISDASKLESATALYRMFL